MSNEMKRHQSEQNPWCVEEKHHLRMLYVRSYFAKKELEEPRLVTEKEEKEE